MEQYILKSALVAEIERLFEKVGNSLGEYRNGAEHTLISIKDFIDKLEVKEVDLEKELIEWHKKHFKKDGTFIRMSGFYLTNNSQMDIAKHFFELGMAVSDKAQKA